MCRTLPRCRIFDTIGGEAKEPVLNFQQKDGYIRNMNPYMPDEEDNDDNAVSSPEETDMVEELINNVIASAREEDFITESYVAIKKTALMYLDGRVDRERFLAVVREMKNRVIDAREKHEEAHLYEDEWTVEVAAGDRLLMEGLNGYEDALAFLEAHACEKNEETIKLGIDMVYEANKKLVLNQCLVHYVENVSSQSLPLSSLLQSLKT